MLLLLLSSSLQMILMPYYVDGAMVMPLVMVYMMAMAKTYSIHRVKIALKYGCYN